MRLYAIEVLDDRDGSYCYVTPECDDLTASNSLSEKNIGKFTFEEVVSILPTLAFELSRVVTIGHA